MLFREKGLLPEVFRGKGLHSKHRNLPDKDGNCLIHYLARDCFNDILRMEKYVKKSDFQIKGKLGKVPLHFAASEGENVQETQNTVKVLLSGMENYLSKDDFGKTVLHHAAENKNDDVRYNFF